MGADPNPQKLQEEAQSLLYRRLISPGGPASVKEVASALRVNPSTLHRQCTGDIKVQVRVLAALAALDREGLMKMLHLIARQLGLQWEWRPVAHSRTGKAEAIRSVLELSKVCAQAATVELGALEDGEVSGAELEALEEQWSREDRAREQMRARIRSLARKREP